MLELKKIKPFIKNIDEMRSLKSDLVITNGHYLVMREFVTQEAWTVFQAHCKQGELNPENLTHLLKLPDERKEIFLTKYMEVQEDSVKSRFHTRILEGNGIRLGVDQDYLELLNTINEPMRMFATSETEPLYLLNPEDKIVAILMPRRL